MTRHGTKPCQSSPVHVTLAFLPTITQTNTLDLVSIQSRISFFSRQSHLHMYSIRELRLSSLHNRRQISIIYLLPENSLAFLLQQLAQQSLTSFSKVVELSSVQKISQRSLTAILVSISKTRL